MEASYSPADRNVAVTPVETDTTNSVFDGPVLVHQTACQYECGSSWGVHLCPSGEG